MATRTHQLLPEGAQYLSGTAVPKLSKLNGTAFPVSSLLFRKDADESAYFKLPIIGYTSGDITFQVIWFSNGAATTGNVIWGAAVSAVSPNLDNVGVLTKSFATEATVSTAHLGGQAQRLHASTVTITSLDNMRASDQVWLRLTRKDDTYIDDVHVTQIVLSYPASSAGLESGGYYDIHTYATYEVCRNETGTTIAKATPVYISGRQGDKILVAPADAANSAKMPAIGLVADAIDTGTDGYVHVIGANKGVNTNAYALNQTLYVAPGGGLTPTKPANPNLIQNIGKVISVGNNGEILILGPGRTNDVPALAQSHVFIGNASGVTEQRQMTFADISGGGGNVTFAGVTVAETTANETPISVSGYSLTGSGDVPALNVAGTWNTSAAPALLRANVTDTLSNAGALLLELRKNNVAHFTVGKEGQVASNAVTISGYSLTGTSATSALDISGTWNTTGTPTAIKLNITDTASNAASLLMDLQRGGTSRLKIDKNGEIIGVQASLRISHGAGQFFGVYSPSLTTAWFSVSAARAVVPLSGSIGFASLTAGIDGPLDVGFFRDGSGILAQRNGTNAQTFRLYNTYTDASNYEALELAHATYSGGQYSILRTITAGTGADNINLVLSPSGTGAITVQVPDGTITGGNVRGGLAIDLQFDRNNVAQVASGNQSVLIGGRRNRATTSYSACVGGQENTATGGGCFVGNGNSALGTDSVTVGGQSVTASGAYSMAQGRSSLADKWGQHAHAAGLFSTSGDAQRSVMVMRNSTADATPTELFIDGSSVRATIPNNKRWLATVRVVASTATATGAWAVFERRCLIGRGASAAATALAGSVIVIGSDSGTNSGSPPAGWAVALTADTTNGSLKVEATGAAATAIRWVAEVSLVEVAYA